MYPRPTQRSESVPRPTVALETAPGSGVFTPDPRLAPLRIDTRALPAIAHARIDVRLDASFDVADAVQRYHPDRRLLIRIDCPPPLAPLTLFDGFVHRLTWKLDTAALDAPQRLSLSARHLAIRWTQSDVLGRFVPHSADAAAAVAPAVLHATALPCVFNRDGRPNCHPIAVALPREGGPPRAVHAFTWDGDPHAVPWTAARAIRYLLAFHRPAGDTIAAADLFAATDAAALLSPDGREAHRDADPLTFDLLQPLHHVNVDARSAADALARVADQAGLLLWPRGDGGADGRTTAWSCTTRRNLAAVELALARGGRDDNGQPFYSVADASVRQILDDNQLSAGRWKSGVTRRTAACVLAGDVALCELTLPLVPGWKPVAGLDNVGPDDRGAAKAAALTTQQVNQLTGDPNENDWFRRYHAAGAEFAAHYEIARLWLLNEDGTLDPAAYNRNPPFDAYAPFTFEPPTTGEPAAPNFFLRRPRRLLPLASPLAALWPGGVVVQLSFDAGTTWSTCPRGYVLLSDRCGIWFDADNPLDVVPPHQAAEQQNLWYALVDQTLRVRVVAAVESDGRLIARPGEGRHTPRSLLAPTRIRLDPTWQARTRSESAAAVIGNHALPNLRDDAPQLRRHANAAADRLAGTRIRARPFVPWIAVEWRIGDRIDLVRGRGPRLASQRPPTTRTPVIVGQTFFFGPRRVGTELRLDVDNGPA